MEVDGMLPIILLHIANLAFNNDVGTAMRSIPLLLLCLLWSLVEVQSQTKYPYLTFKGNNLPNHSYVDITQVGDDQYGDDSNTVQCHTDLMTCCSDGLELPPGDWFTPSNTQLTNSRSSDMFQDRNSRVVHLRRWPWEVTGPTGIYHCFIATNAVHNDSDGSVGEILYVGLYGSGGGMSSSYERKAIVSYGHISYDLLLFHTCMG